ncbi:MAG: DUF1302 family protein [Gammaproteobacteria bacterium]
MISPATWLKPYGIAGATAVLNALAIPPGAAVDWNISGHVRQEIAYSLADRPNEFNQMGNLFNARITPHYTHPGWGSGRNSRAPSTVFIDTDGNAGFFQQAAGGSVPGGGPGALVSGAGTLAAGAYTLSSANCRFGHHNAIAAGSRGLGGSGTFRGVRCPNGAGTSYVPGVLPSASGAAAAGFSAQGAAFDDDLRFNLFNSRLEVDVQARFNSEFSAFARLRAYVDSTANFTDGVIGNRFENPYWGDRSTLVEWSTPSAMVDLPALYLDFHRGPLWLRFGNQTIAWGEAYFFRVMDVANGLDLRRHLTLGPGGEEFQDQRIASPALRLNYSFADGIEVDAFASLFSATVLPPQNTAYSLITSSITLDERAEFDDAQGALNFGVRLSLPLSPQLTVMAMYTNRRNPDGVFRYAEAPQINGGMINPLCSGPNNAANNLLGAFPGGALVPGGPTLPAGPLHAAVRAAGLDAMPVTLGGSHKSLAHCGAAFAPDGHGPGSTEFWRVIGQSRLDPMRALRTAVDEWPATQWAVRQIFGFGAERNVADVLRTLEAFHSQLGGFRAFATREFKREEVFALGANYIVQTDDPRSFFDSLIVRGEVAVTPGKAFTDLGLSRDFIEDTDIVSALIIEKFHRFSESIPATYMVWQWMHREASDLFGRHLSGTESVPFSAFVDEVTGDFTPAAFVDGAAAPRGSGSADYVVFGFQQPSASLIWRLDMAVLVDIEGGFLVQPGLRYRPSGDWQFDLYANLMREGGGYNDDIMETLDFADELFFRITHFF